MRLLLIALSFFTRIPLKFKKEVTQQEFFESMLFLPVVGFFIGGILFIFSYLIRNVSFLNAKALLTLLLYIYITGGLHLDGVADTIDGIFSARNRDKMFEIMQDSRLGTFGAVGLILLILALFTGFNYIYESHFFTVLLVFPVVGRFSALLLGGISKPASLGGGLAKGFCKVDKLWVSIVYLLIILPILYFLLNKKIFIAFLICILATLLESVYFKYKLGGISGDQFGLTIELQQIVFIYSCILISN